ncbi:MAG: hypothetical protein V6Z86_07380 [Hyphomicrobiales bacterium]
MTADATRRLGIGFLDRLNYCGAALKGLAEGGPVGMTPHYRPPPIAPAAHAPAPRVTIKIENRGEPVEVEKVKTRRDEAGNIDVEAKIRAIVRDEVLNPGRPTARQLKQMGVAPKLVRR